MLKIMFLKHNNKQAKLRKTKKIVIYAHETYLLSKYVTYKCYIFIDNATYKIIIAIFAV